jgi:TIR domain
VFRFPYETAGRPPRFARPAARTDRRRRSVFLSHVGADFDQITLLAAALTEHGFDPWIDRSELTGGQRWKSQLDKAIRGVDYFLACFSPNVAKAESYMNEELIIAIDRFRLMPRDRVWFIPAKLSPCTVPDLPIGPGETVADLQCVDFSAGWDAAMERLLRALNAPDRYAG